MLYKKDNNFIHHTKGLLTSEQCENLIYYFHLRENDHRVGLIGDGEHRSKDKSCTELGITLDAFSLETGVGILFLPVIRALNKACMGYKNKYPFLNNIAPWAINENLNIQYYKPNEGYFHEHCENDGFFLGSKVSRRMMAWMIYLNDVNDGGETFFPTQNLKFKPRCGDVLLWPAFWTHSHHGITSPTQEKYIMTGWYVYQGQTIPQNSEEASGGIDWKSPNIS